MIDSILVSVGETRRRRLDAMFEGDPFAAPYLRALSTEPTLAHAGPEDVAPATTSLLRPSDMATGAARTSDCELVEQKTPSAHEPFPEVLTIDDAARFLRVGPESVRKLVRSHGMPHVRLGRRMRLRRVAILQWLASRETAATPPASAHSVQV